MISADNAIIKYIYIYVETPIVCQDLKVFMIHHHHRKKREA